MPKRKYESIDITLDDATVKFLSEVRKYTRHPTETVLEVLIGLWAYHEGITRKTRGESK